MIAVCAAVVAAGACDRAREARDAQRLRGVMRREADAAVRAYHAALMRGDTGAILRLSVASRRPDAAAIRLGAPGVGPISGVDRFEVGLSEGRARFRYRLNGEETTGAAFLEWRDGRWKVEHYFMISEE